VLSTEIANNLESAPKTAKEAHKMINEQEELRSWHTDLGNGHLEAIAADLGVLLKASQGRRAPAWLE